MGQGGGAKTVDALFTVTDDPYQSFQSLDNTDSLPQEQKHPLMLSDHSFKIKARAQGKEYQKHNLSVFSMFTFHQFPLHP